MIRHSAYIEDVSLFASYTIKINVLKLLQYIKFIYTCHKSDKIADCSKTPTRRFDTYTDTYENEIIIKNKYINEKFKCQGKLL